MNWEACVPAKHKVHLFDPCGLSLGIKKLMKSSDTPKSGSNKENMQTADTQGSMNT